MYLFKYYYHGQGFCEDSILLGKIEQEDVERVKSFIDNQPTDDSEGYYYELKEELSNINKDELSSILGS